MALVGASRGLWLHFSCTVYLRLISLLLFTYTSGFYTGHGVLLLSKRLLVGRSPKALLEGASVVPSLQSP